MRSRKLFYLFPKYQKKKKKLKCEVRNYFLYLANVHEITSSDFLILIASPYC